MPRSHYAALEQAKRAFDGVCVNIAHNISLFTVIDYFVPRDSCLPHGDRMRSEIVRHNYVNIFADVLADELGERTGLSISGMEHSEIAIAFADTHNDFFIFVFADVTFAAIPAADVGFVQFHGAAKFRFRGGRHSSADAVAEIPSGFVTADSQSALDLASGHSLFRFAHEHGRSEPSNERKMGVVKNAASGYAELEITGLAVVKNFFGFEFNDRFAATSTARTIRPAQARKELAALIVGRKRFIHVN
jgi:hypothetical protein